MIRKVQGTVVLSAVGMFGSGGGWGLALPSHTLGITVGDITQKPGVHNGEIAIREYLNVTRDFDHNIVDGAPASRFAQRFRDLVEGGSGLHPV
ncbi:2-oxo acid dehydrogenase subunit E2 [Demequina sp.]|uniref:2-oxo acid dehydrogenase subunit E2 n=1 Tax=Demequina sp. TaxID=2050685 RepID=UPI0025BE2679|nr:2-oxo acid dehydrogenase subunit E2 [Demequina sp.]